MAAETPKTRALDYGLRDTTLNRVRQAQGVIQKEGDLQMGEVISDIGEDITTAAKEKLIASEATKDAWEVGMSSYDGRDTWYNDRTFNQVQEFEASQRELYINADPITQKRMLKEQQTRAGSVKKLKSAMELIKYNYDNNLFSVEGMTEEERGWMAAIAKQEDTEVIIENNEVKWKLADGTVIDIPKINNLLKNGLTEDFGLLDRIDASRAAGGAGTAWDDATSRASRSASQQLLNKNNIRKFYFDGGVYGDTPIAELMLEHPVFKIGQDDTGAVESQTANIPFGGMKNALPEDASSELKQAFADAEALDDGDGVLTAEEINKKDEDPDSPNFGNFILDADERQLIIQEMLRTDADGNMPHFEIAQKFGIDFIEMIEMQEQYLARENYIETQAKILAKSKEYG